MLIAFNYRLLRNVVTRWLHIRVIIAVRQEAALGGTRTHTSSYELVSLEERDPLDWLQGSLPQSIRFLAANHLDVSALSESRRPQGRLYS